MAVCIKCNNQIKCTCPIEMIITDPKKNAKKTKGRLKVRMERITNKARRYTTFCKRKSGLMKKAYELSQLTGAEVMLLVASETGHVYTYATDKLSPIISNDKGRELFASCLSVNIDQPTKPSNPEPQKNILHPCQYDDINSQDKFT
ncbi:hypothetical protein A3Q56_06645 [Intoshia linei]|uniref:MADS-box domain-containing protein n=1 Tax=Intoshia linei TaxID=1819745 RepID=A0A177AUG9_9BILA|nr:hypothetical protein A3Q56_06645 [Intoshia linei]